jgi:hypothetical protein|tara:strand:+ start:243 stop:572 length:330 start_codon:yes stop_codon:yes gene_type:complete
MGKGKKYSYGHGGGMMMPVKKMMMKDGGSLKDVPSGSKGKGLSQLPTAVRNKMGYKKMGGQTESMLSKMTKGGMMDMSDPAVLKMRYGGSMVEPKIKMMGGSTYGKKKK